MAERKTNWMLKGVLVPLAAYMAIWVFTHLLTGRFGEWSLSVAVGVAMLLFWPVMNHFFRKGRIAGIVYKIDSQKGLGLVDRLGTRYANFWKAIGDLGIVLLTGGVGAAFVAYHVAGRARRIFIGLLAGGAALSLGIFQFQARVPDMWPGALIFAILAFAAALAAARLAPRLSKGRFALLSFALASVLLAAIAPSIVRSLLGGSPMPLIYSFFVGAFGLSFMLLLRFLEFGFAFAFGSLPYSAIYPTLPAIENGTAVFKAPGGVGPSLPIFPDMLVAFIVMLVLHEGFHGLLARAQGIKLKNTGLITASILPLGAFVEPDKEAFEKADELKSARVYVAGSFVNIFVISTIAFALGGLMLFSGFAHVDGIEAAQVYNDTPAAGFMQPGDVLESVNGRPILSYAEFSDVMSWTSPNQTVVVTTDKGAFEARLATHPDYPDRGYMGMATKCDYLGSVYSPQAMCSHISPDYAALLFRILKMVFLLNLMVGLFNLLPIPILDGYGMYSKVFGGLDKASTRCGRRRIGIALMGGMTLIMAAALALNIFPYFVRDWADLALLAVAAIAFILAGSKFRRSKAGKAVSKKGMPAARKKSK